MELIPALTDALIAGIANGKRDYKLVGRYISSSLRWAIITGKDSKYNEIDQLKGTTFGISRLGSCVRDTWLVVLELTAAARRSWPRSSPSSRAGARTSSPSSR